MDLVKKAPRHNIPRGCQKEYIPGLSDESSDLLKLYDEEYNKDPFSESTIKLGDTLLDEISDERRNIWRDMVENTNITMNSKKKHGQPSLVLGQTMSPLPWSLLSLLTKSLTNYCLMEEGWNTEGHPASTTKQSFQVTTSHQLSLLSLSAWTNSQLTSACWKQGKLLAWMVYKQKCYNILATKLNLGSWTCSTNVQAQSISHLSGGKHGDSHTKAWEGPLLPKKLPSNLAAVHSI